MLRRLFLLWLLILSFFVMVACAQPASPSPQIHINLPDDVPVLDGALGVFIDTIGLDTIVNYRFVTTDLGIVLAYYESALIRAGWGPDSQADIVADDAATLVRVNEAGDVITVTLTRDEQTGSVLVDLDIERAE